MTPFAPSFRTGARARRFVLPGVILATSLCAGAMVPSPGLLRPVIATAVAFLLVILAFSAPRNLLLVLAPWLAALGLLRRLLSGVTPAQAAGDPLILVAAAAWMVASLIAFRRGAFAALTPLAKFVLALTCLLILSAANPLQGNLLVGLGGVVLVVVPMLAFWVGRQLVDDRTLAIVIRLIAILACAAAVYGLIQTFSGFPSWDERWIVTSGYVALDVNGITRAFSSFSSSSEYATYLALGLVGLLAYARRARLLTFLLIPSALLCTALWFESARSVIVLTVAALVLMVAAAKGLSLPRSILFGAVLVAALPFIVGHVASSGLGSASGTGARLASHQLQGLSDPFGQSSTLPTHISEIVRGIEQSVRNPLGHGVGSITIAANKFGGAQSGTEGDPGNAGVAAGFLGLAAYAGVLVAGFATAYRVARTRRDTISLAVLGMVVVTLLQWLNGGQYAVAFVPWLLLGWCDATASRHLGQNATSIGQMAA